MGNPLPSKITTGTYGELLVILRLLDFDIQACFTLKDSGNDLIAVKDSIMRTIQVKSTTKKKWTGLGELRKKRYDILALVSLIPKERGFDLEKSKIFLLKKDQVQRTTISDNEEITQYSLDKTTQKLFSNN